MPIPIEYQSHINPDGSTNINKTNMPRTNINVTELEEAKALVAKAITIMRNMQEDNQVTQDHSLGIITTLEGTIE